MTTIMITINGHADDVIEVEGNFVGADDYEYWGEGPYMGYLFFAAESTGEELRVDVILNGAGCWSFAPGLAEQHGAMPEWEMAIGQYGEHSAQLTIRAPSDVTCKFLAPR